MTFRAGLIGYGAGGRIFHAPLLARAGIELAAIASSKTDLIARDFPNAKACATPESLLADQSLDLVIVSTPSPTHADVAVAALGAGHNVVVDKPFAPTLEDADRIIAAADKAGRLVSCFQNRRWDSDFLTVQEILKAGMLGDVHEYRAHFEFYKPDAGGGWKNESLPGVGVHYDLGTHMIDQVMMLFGMPEWVQADLRTVRTNGQAPDQVVVRLGYGSMRATLIASMLSANTDERYVIHGSKGSFSKQFMDGQEEQLKGGMQATDPAYGVEDPSTYGTLTVQDGEGTKASSHQSLVGQHWRYYELMREAIQNGTPVPVPAQAPRDGLRIIQALVKSSESGSREAL